MAVELLQRISTNEDERARFRARRKFRMDMEHNLAAARDEGKAEVARNLLNISMPVEQIVTATGLTREEIEGMRVAN